MEQEEIPTFSENQTVEEKLQQMEKQNRGLIKDLAEKRQTIRSLEERMAHVETSLTTAADDNGEVRPEERVNRLAQDPDGYISDIVEQAVKPLQDTILAMTAAQKVDAARRWIAKREKIDPDEVEAKFGEDLIRIGKERGLTKLDPEEGIKSAYEIMLQERRDKEEREAQRDRDIENRSTESVRVPPRSSGPALFTRDQLRRMSMEEYNRRRDEIRQAEVEGRIKT